jgi:hypothetical protein
VHLNRPHLNRPRRRLGRRVAGAALTASAFLLVLAALLVPDRPDLLGVSAFARIPLEGVLAAGAALLLPRRPARVLAALAGLALGLLAVGALLDLGFVSVLVRPFDPVLDWALVGDAVEFLATSLGRPAAIVVAVLAALLAVAVVALVTAALLRVVHVVGRRRSVTTPIVVAVALVAAGCCSFDVRDGQAGPVAADVVLARAEQRTAQVRHGLADRTAFLAAADHDAFAGVPAGQVLTGLRGKDVLVAFVESYGRSALEDPALAPRTGAALDAGEARLRAKGFSARSAFLTSPTVGGGSWLAHSTLLSGLWIDSQQRYRTFVASDRLTLGGAFRRAGWRTIGVMPGVTRAWPEGRVYDFGRVYDSRQMGYRGPNFSWAPMPDQYALSTYQRAESAVAQRPPLMTVLPMVSSHGPWAPLPRLVDWADVGDGSVFAPMPAEGERAEDVLGDPAKVRAAYADSVSYSIDALLSYVERYGDDRTVLVFLGDHQPAPVVTGPGASRDVPVTIVARDPAVLARVSAWGWDDGLRPRPDAPVWRMDAFRDRFLTAFR